jgi:ankyrin repeat protein
MDMVLQLLKNGADPNAKNTYSYTPLHIATRYEHSEIIKALIESGADPNAKNSNSDTPLHIAIEHEHSEIIKALIESGADPNAKNSNSDTPLHIAIEHELLDVIKVLLDMGADINAKNIYSDTPLHIAIEHELLDVIKVLLDMGADINAKNSNYNTPLHIAIEHELLDVIAILLERGADVNAKNSNYNTPLHIAIEHELLDVIAILLERGADVNTKNPYSDTPLYIAIEHELLDVIAILLERGADVNAKKFNSDTPLHIAIQHELLDVIAILLERGADVNIPGKNGVTTSMMALKKGLHGVVDKLLQAGALLREAIQKQVILGRNGSQVTGVEISVDWNVSQFVKNELSGVEDLRKAVTLTGSVQNAQMMSCEDYVAQTWGNSGLKVLDTLIESLRRGHAELNDSERRAEGFVGRSMERYAESNIPDRQRVTFDSKGDTVRITVNAPEKFTVDLMEQIAWLGCVFTCEQENSGHGPFLATGYYWRPFDFDYQSLSYHLVIKSCSLKGYLEEPCWTNILRSATLAVGFPLRKRPEGIGLEIPFPLLLRFADISVSMDYDGGTILVGASTILFPSQKLEDGIQWHIADATSAQEAVQVIDRSPNWIQTRDIGELAEFRAYLGYCKHALVLLGTRDLVISQSTVELSCQLPKTGSHIEMAHEGTMSAGFSIRGIFNTTVGGKWVVPTRLNVGLEDNRDIEDLLMNARRRPVLVYDRNEDRGWLVPELSLVSHMALSYLNQPDVLQRCLSSVRDSLPYLTAAADGGLEAYNVVRDHWNLELYEKIEDGKMKTFGMVIRDFMKDLQKLRIAENARRESKGWKLSLFSGRSLRGWDFSELASKAENMFQREMKWEFGSGPIWTTLGDTEDMVVIMGSRLGDLLYPDLLKTKVMSGWETVPSGAGLLAATNLCVMHLTQKRVLQTPSEIAASKQHSESKLFWYRPTLHRDCNELCNESCLTIHEITRQGSRTCTETRAPRKLPNDGAVVFGCASFYHKSLKRGSR